MFGQTRRELELSESRKRLRVENETIGRSGGVFVGGTGMSTVKNRLAHDGRDESENTQLGLEDIPTNRAMVIQENPPDRVAGLTGA